MKMGGGGGALISAVNWYLSGRSTSWFAEGLQKLPRDNGKILKWKSGVF